MAIKTVEGALDQLRRCRSDFESQVRVRRAQAKEQIAAAATTAATLKAADAEALEFLQKVIQDAATPPPLKQKLQGDVAFHQRAKQDQAAEA